MCMIVYVHDCLANGANLVSGPQTAFQLTHAHMHGGGLLLHPQPLLLKSKVRTLPSKQLKTKPGENRNRQNLSIKTRENHHLQILDFTIETVPHETCLGYTWSHNLSQDKVLKQHKQGQTAIFAHGSSGSFLGHSNNPLLAREVFETCVIPTEN